MGIRIKEINIKNLGPIDTPISLKLNLFNLIYGHNEKGKTLLVEFLIKSLFKNKKPWTVRSIKGNGKIKVAGIDDIMVDFSPSSKNKLEDYFDKSIPGLPPDFSKLLVVKGAELELGTVNGGIDKNIVKHFLSSKGVFEKIEKSIPATIKEAQLEEQEIIGKNQGDIKTRAELKKKIQDIQKLFEEVNNLYSKGYRSELEKERNRLQGQEDALIIAKQHLAYKISNEIDKLKDQLSYIDKETLDEISRNIHSYNTKQNEFNSKKDEQKNAESESKHFNWLKLAKKNYEEINNKIIKLPMPIMFVFTFISIITSIILLLFKMFVGSIIAISLTFILFSIFWLLKSKLRISSQAIIEKEELVKEFKSRFNKDLEGLTQIEEILLGMEKIYNRSEFLKEQLREELQSLEGIQTNISNYFEELTGKEISEDNWVDTLTVEKQRREKLNTLIRDKEIELASLNVDKSDYKEVGNDTVYSKKKLDDVRSELQKIDESLGEHNNNLEGLKQSICQITGKEISATWDEIIAALQDIQDETISNCKERTAKILGQIMVHNVLKELETEEDRKIIDVLESETIKEPLFALTQRYNEILLEDDDLIVKDNYNDFLFKDISTGASEQILLALRIGFSSRLLQKDRLFLILDDAFQYSDWERRPLLVKKMAVLANLGWQIIYFTMDDHIKDLFNEAGKNFGNEYSFIELK